MYRYTQTDLGPTVMDTSGSPRNLRTVSDGWFPVTDRAELLLRNLVHEFSSTGRNRQHTENVTLESGTGAAHVFYDNWLVGKKGHRTPGDR